MTEPLKAEGVPEDLRAILDQAAGKEHSTTGPVMTCLAEILTKHKQQIRAQVSAEILAAKGTDPRFASGWASTQDRDHAAAIALGES